MAPVMRPLSVSWRKYASIGISVAGGGDGGLAAAPDGTRGAARPERGREIARAARSMTGPRQATA